MVQVAITARNPADGNTRVWGLSIDEIPSGNWLKNSAIVKTDKKTGELWTTNLQIPDGRHKIYFIISQTPGLGTYSGEALFDQAGFNFSGVDNDSLVAFDVLVKSGKAVRSTGVPATTGADDIDKPKFYTPIKARLNEVGDKVRGITWSWKHGVGIAVIIGGTLGGLYLYKKMSKNGRRRF